jgi:2-keto-4-pentenoate hydratase
MWRVLKLDTLVWAYTYGHTLIQAGRSAPLSLGTMVSPKIEPEIVFKLRAPVDGANLDAAAVLNSGGELVSSGTLTEAPPIAPGETWSATLQGVDLSDLTLTTTP